MARVVVLGSSGYDLTVRLPRLPRPGETLLGGALHRGPGGKGANAAVAARKAGGEVVFLTAFGDDEFGRELIENDKNLGIDITFAKIPGKVSNQVALILVGEDGDNLIAVSPGASEEFRPEDVAALPGEVFVPSGVMLACLEVPRDTVVAGLRRAKRAGMVTILNPAPADPFVVDEAAGLVDVLTPNQEEAAVLTGMETGSVEEADRAARVLRDRMGADVVVTLGGRGCLVVPRGGGGNLVPAPRVEVVDTVGAGDVFNGALAVALAEGLPLIEAAMRACVAGGLAVTRPGAQGAIPTREEIDAALAAAGLRKQAETGR